jgi:digeranylgeranylglycerophospholipid reductase
MARNYDLVVIGAGFAGLAAAQAAAMRGIKTLVMDCKPQAGSKLHTTALLVKEVADLWDVPRDLTRKIHGVRLYGPSLRSIDLVRPGYHFLATDAPGLLRWWAQQARTAGALVRFNSPYRGARRAEGSIHLEEYDIRARYLLGADGPRSRVAQHFGLGANRRFLVGVEAEYEGVEGVDPDRLHVFLDWRIAPGYIAWVVPGVHHTQVGLAVHRGRTADVSALVARIGGLFNFSGAKVVAKRGGLIPIGGPVSPLGASGVMLIGDAAGMVSPLTGGGIHTSLHLGRLAGLAITDHLLDAGRDPAEIVRLATPRYFTKRLLRLAYDVLPSNALYDAALSSRLFRLLAQTIFFHNRGLLSWQTWTDVTRQLLTRQAPAIEGS